MKTVKIDQSLNNNTMKKLNQTMYSINKNFNVKKVLLIAGMSVLGYLPLCAQDKAPVATLETANPGRQTAKLNRFSLGLKVTNLYDLRYTSYDLLTSGVSASDPHGLNGGKTKFDLAAGIDVNYFFSPMFSMDLGYEKGKMTGANKTEYYESSVSFLTLGGNIDLKRSVRTKDYKLVPYARFSVASAKYETERKFILDDAVFNKTSGTAIQLGVGLGLRYHINNNWCLNLMSEFVTTNTDAWDGYDYGTGKDQMIKTSLGLKYAFGGGKHVDRTLAWQDNRVDQLQARIDEQVNAAVKGINDTVDTRFKKIMNTPGNKDSDDDGIVDKFDKCPDVAGLFSNNGCPPIEEVVKEKEKEASVDQSIAKTNAPAAVAAVVASGNSGGSSKGLSNEEKYRLKNEILVEMTPIRFDFNSYQLNAKAYEQLNTIAVIMRNNSSYKLSLKGFTDDAGSADYNKKLSEQRANSVAEYLNSRGISKDRIKILAVGKDSPLDDNSSKIGKSNNRRVECKLD